MPLPPKHNSHDADAHKRRLATELTRQLQQNGYTAYWAGGCVRDAYLGIIPKDYDIATNATPDAILKLFPDGDAIGKSFGVIAVNREGWPFEIATFRIDHGIKDGRHPESISFATAEEDAQRRDLTINAMFFDPISNTIHDWVNGQRDLDQGIIRSVGNPRQRFAEDHLRLLRAVRFAVRLDFTINPQTEKAIIEAAPKLSAISPERIRDEFSRIMLEAAHPGQALRMLDDLKLLEAFLPEVNALKHQNQPPEFHPEGDVFTHTVMMLDRMEHRDLTLMLSVLLHDIAKPVVAKFRDGRLRFHGHADKGAIMTQNILKRLKYPNRIIEAVTACVKGHMRFMEVQNMRRSTLRRLVGAPTFDTELELHRLDCLACHGMLDNYDFLRQTVDEFNSEPALPAPWITGKDLIAAGLNPGPHFGKILKQAYDLQLEGQSPSREALLQQLKLVPRS